MRLSPWEEGIFRRRPNRFLAEVEMEGESLQAHVPDPGRLEELLLPGCAVRLRKVGGRSRKTGWDLIGVESPGGWVNIDSRLPNLLFADSVSRGLLLEFSSYSRIRSEYPFGNSILDFRLDGERGSCLVEVKGCTLVRNGLALFPDAPTERGARHLQELRRALTDGFRSCLVVIVKRADAEAFAPCPEIDPRFAEALREAVASGVEVIPYLAPWRGEDIEIVSRLLLRP